MSKRKSMQEIVNGILNSLDPVTYKSAKAIATEAGTNTETVVRYMELINLIQGSIKIRTETTDQGKVYKRGP